MWHVYILKCFDDSFYTGLSCNLNKRILEHQSGKGSKYTSTRLPIILEYSEKFKLRKNAEQRERQIKKWARAKKEALIAGDLIRLQNASKSKS